MPLLMDWEKEDANGSKHGEQHDPASFLEKLMRACEARRAMLDGQEDSCPRPCWLASTSSSPSDIRRSATVASLLSSGTERFADVTMRQTLRFALGEALALEESRNAVSVQGLEETLGRVTGADLDWGEADDSYALAATGGSDLASTLRFHLTDESLSLEGGPDGGLIDILLQLGEDSLGSFSESTHQAPGNQLLEEKVFALSKVQFEACQQQSCVICLEAYEQGELLASLNCGHLFHVDCVAGWMRRASHCPLCRTDI